MNRVDLRRQRAGLTLAALARAAGTAESNLSQYERGAKRPNDATQQRLQLLLGVNAQSCIYRHNLVTAPAAAAAIRKTLRRSHSTPELFLIVREMVNNASEIEDDKDRAAFFAPPGTTGDVRWDAMLAGVVEDWMLQRAYAPPAWVRGHQVTPLWNVGGVAGLFAVALANTPSSLRVRGVIIERAALESV